MQVKGDPVPHRPLVCYFFLHPRSEAEQFGGTGIFLLSRLNYLKSLGERIRLRVVPVRDAGPRRAAPWAKIASLLAYIARELGSLLGQPGRIYYLVYPKIPLVAHGVAAWTWFPALLGYAALWARKKFTRTRVIVEIEDLPVERARLSASAHVPDLSLCTWKYLDRREWLYTILEWVIFHAADRIISPSQPFSEHVVAKFGVRPGRIALYRREIYMPGDTANPTIGPLPGMREVNLFYSAGNLATDLHAENLRLLLDAMADLPQAALYICGGEGEQLVRYCRERRLLNVHYLGLLSHADHDAAARQCQIGLLLYAHSYADFKCTAKYPAYVANGLAVLSTDLLVLSQMIAEDGVGRALPMPELLAELRRWVAQPEIVAGYRQQAQRLAPAYLNGDWMAEWFLQELESR